MTALTIRDALAKARGQELIAAGCQHDPRYSRSECALCGDQVSWCDKCGADLCGCVIPPNASALSERVQ